MYVPPSGQVQTALRALAQYHARLDRPPAYAKAETKGSQLVVVYRQVRSLLYTAREERVSVPGVSPALAAAGPAGLDAAIVAAGDAVRSRLPLHVPVIYSPSLPLLVPSALAFAAWLVVRPLPWLQDRFPRVWKPYDRLVRGLVRAHALEAVVMFAYNRFARKAPLKIAALWALNQFLIGVFTFPAYFKLNPRSLALQPTRPPK